MFAVDNRGTRPVGDPSDRTEEVGECGRYCSQEDVLKKRSNSVLSLDRKCVAFHSTCSDAL